MSWCTTEAGIIIIIIIVSSSNNNNNYYRAATKNRNYNTNCCHESADMIAADLWTF